MVEIVRNNTVCKSCKHFSIASESICHACYNESEYEYQQALSERRDSMDNYEKLIEALETIKEECKRNDNCIECPLGNSNGHCKLLHANPEDWKIKKQVKTVTRIFE